MDGDHVRIKSSGRVVRLEVVNPNPDFDPEDEIWAEGWGPEGTVEINGPDEVEKVDYSPPSMDDLGRLVGFMILGHEGDLEITETHFDGQQVIDIGCKWRGVEGTFTLKLSDFEEML